MQVNFRDQDDRSLSPQKAVEIKIRDQESRRKLHIDVTDNVILT